VPIGPDSSTPPPPFGGDEVLHPRMSIRSRIGSPCA
jgi:hypothetical protein